MALFNFTNEQRVWKQGMLAAYARLVSARDAFISHVRQDTLPVWAPTDGFVRPEAAALYGDFFFPNDPLDESDPGAKSHPNVVSKGCGVIGASPSTIEMARAFNLAKEEFNASLVPMRGNTILVEQGEGRKAVPMALDRAVLKDCGLSVLSERQACRRILILEAIPARIAFLWVSVPSNSKVTVAEVRLRLQDMNISPAVASDLRALDLLNDDEPLVFVKELNPHLRVKVGDYQTPDFVRAPARKKVLKDKLLAYTQYTTSMPVLLQMAPGETLPLIRPPRGYPGQAASGNPDAKTKEKNKPQQKRKLEQVPYLKTMKIYRYQEVYRQEIRRSAEWLRKLEGAHMPITSA